MTDGKLVDKQVLKTLTPLGVLNFENFQEVASKSRIEEIPPGRTLFRIGDNDRRTVYLLEGQLMLTGADGESVVIEAGSEAARHPIGNHQPRQYTAKTRTDCRITHIDSDLLDILLTWDQLSGIEVSELDVMAAETDDDDWMTRLLQSKAFMQVPAANIQAMFMRMEEVAVQAGDVIVRQGDEGDYYYLVKAGRAKVTRAAKAGAEIMLAQLEAGSAFGEEALLSDGRRNATVTMETDGALMRLSKADFVALLREPALNWIDLDEAEAKVATGAKWLDVRLESEHANAPLPGSLNLPLFMLRLKAESLDPTVPYVVYCDTGRRSSAAAFLLGERGFRTFVLRGGIGGQTA